jgi:hypothetical protein
LLAAAVLAAATGCTGRYAEIEDRRVEARYALPEAVREVRLDLLEGAVTFRPGAAGVVRIEALARRASVDAAGLAALQGLDLRPQPLDGAEPGVFALQGPRLPPGTRYPEQRIVLRCLVEVPADIAVSCVTGSGHVAAIGRRADVRLESGHGDVRLDDCRGDATLRSGRGAVVVDKHRGSLDIELAVVGGERLPERAQRKGETMQLFVEELGLRGVRVVAPDANVQCHLPAGAGFALDVTTRAGRGRNAFGVPVQPLEGTNFGVQMRGVVGGGGPPVHIAVGYGNVSVGARPDSG